MSKDFSDIAYEVDQRCRTELIQGVIPDERTYVATLVTRLRDRWRAYGLKADAHAQVLPPSVEQKLGCDAIVVIRNPNHVKVGLFEAKWPRFNRASYPWDARQSSSKPSHFSNQLAKQAGWAKACGVWELFANERPVASGPKGFISRASTCVWHEDAIAFDGKRASSGGPWTTADLLSMVGAGGVAHRLSTVLSVLQRCDAGESFQVVGHVARHAQADLSVPLPGEGGDLRDPLAVFCEANAIRSYLYVEPGELDLDAYARSREVSREGRD